MTDIGFGVIGAGYMGKAYAIALSQVSTVYEMPHRAVKRVIATSDATGAERRARDFGFQRGTGDWRALLAADDVQAVAIASPTFLHAEMAVAALQAGKHVLCEKPLGRTAREAASMAKAAQASGRVTMTGFNYIKNPATQLAREIIAAGEIGEVIHFAATHVEDYLMDPDLPHDWRQVAANVGRAGALGDIASHAINLAHFLIGPVAEVVGMRQTVHAQRPAAAGGMAAVENDDQAQFLMRFASGVPGSITASRIHAGRKMGLTYEVVGTRGTVRFDQERMAELQFYDAADRKGRQGFRTILAAPGHKDYGRFCIGAGHGFGYNDMIVVEMAEFIRAIAEDSPAWPDFAAAAHTAAVVDAVLASCDARAWTSVAEIESEAWV
jgi:predicted dehydrogenase